LVRGDRIGGDRGGNARALLRSSGVVVGLALDCTTATAVAHV
jgi:hypothetical protein